MPDSYQLKSWHVFLMVALFFGLAVLYAVDGRLVRAGFAALVAAGWGVMMTAPDVGRPSNDWKRGPRFWVGATLFLVGIAGPVFFG